MSSWRAVGVAIVAVIGLVACGAPAIETQAPPFAATPSAAPIERAAAGQAPERLVEPITIGARPPQPDLAPRFAAALVVDPCADRDLAAPEADDVALAVLDRSYALPAAYVPEDLVPAAQAGLTGSSGTKLVRAVVLGDLAAMNAAWQAAGLSMIVESAYRSYGAQASTFADWVSRVGTAEALRRSARPGHSEHQLGTTFDLTSPGWAGRFGDWATESAEGAWMVEHGWEYGFVMSYPWGAEAETCFGYEPWHWRWIGREAAAEHRAGGLSLRAYLVDRLRGG